MTAHAIGQFLPLSPIECLVEYLDYDISGDRMLPNSLSTEESPFKLAGMCPQHVDVG